MQSPGSGRLRLLIALGVVCSLVGCDQATKQIAVRMLQHEASSSYLHDSVRLEYALNPGGFLSLGASLPDGFRAWFFIGANVILLAGVGIWLLKRPGQHPVIFISLLCILAGGIGNLIDRVTNDGLVIDFVSGGGGPLRTGVFNVADVGVMFGAISLMYFAGRQSQSAASAMPADKDSAQPEP